METNETGLRTREEGFSPLVYTDSCMELFLMPDPENSSCYLNWEFNPAGAMCLAAGTSRHDRSPVSREDYRELFQVKTMTHNEGWNLEFHIPLNFPRRFFPGADLRPSRVMAANFYKCGDRTSRPHFGCWSPIELPAPDFHCPAFFGSLLVK
jgi:hypothetical protein